MQTFKDPATGKVHSYEDNVYIEDGMIYSEINYGAIVGQAPLGLEPYVVPEPEPTILTENNFIRGVQNHLDKVAQSRKYDNMSSLISYVGDSDPIFGEEGNAGKLFRSEVWRYCINQLGFISDGSRPAPETVGDFIAELPEINW